MKKNILSLILILFAFAGAKAGDIETIKKNYSQLILAENRSEKELISVLVTDPKETYYSDQMVVELMDRYPIQKAEVSALLDKLQANGTWSDIDYTDKNRSGWQPKRHVERILLLAKAYRMQNSGYYNSTEVEAAIHRAFTYWFDARLISPNWWYTEIGIPKAMGAIMVIFEDKLNRQEKENILKYMKNSKFRMTGQNKVWLAGNVLVRALMQGNMEQVKAARDTIFSEITVGNVEGIKADNSFHQHGAQLQFGNYGAAYIASMGLWSQVLAGTSLALEQSQLDILSRLIDQGYRRTLWKGYMDVNALGRQFFRQAQRHKALSVGFTASMLMDADKPNSTKYRELLDENFYKLSQPAGMTGLYHFWMSDYTVQRRPGWMASVRMSSPRIIGAEALNGDNLKGYYLADGALYVYVDGNEYHNIFPVWDWQKLPGVTAYATTQPLKQLQIKGYHNKSTFVGNVNNGKTGLTSMLLDRDGLRAHKSWIFADDYILCLGAGIRADSGVVVTTSIDQRIKTADLLQLKNNRWLKTTSEDFRKTSDLRFFHDKTGYVIMNVEKGRAVTEKRTGAWKEVMNMYPADFTETKDVMSLWIDHGKDPRNGTYQYLILPASTTSKVKQFDTRPIKVLSNTSKQQAVTIGSTTYVAAYPLADIMVVEGIRFQSTNTGLFMIEEEANRTKVTVVDPTQSQTHMDVTLNGQKQTVQLPGGEEKGTPVIIYFSK